MRFGINLRGDLARLSDTEIASEFDRLLAERQAIETSLPGAIGGWEWQANTFPWTWFGRGPFHARVFYKLVALYFGPSKTTYGALYLLDCEIKDVRDELQRRISQHRARAEIAT
jgi:hypothetical protein